MRHPASLNLFAWLFLLVAMTVSVRAARRTAPATSEPLLQPDAAGGEIYGGGSARVRAQDISQPTLTTTNRRAAHVVESAGWCRPVP